MGAEANSRGLPEFDPFQNRLCRDIRNELSERLMAILAGTGGGMLSSIAESYTSGNIEPFMRDYIDDRLSRYQTVFNQIRVAKIPRDETYGIALLLWDEELFFEVHEWLEKRWLVAHGTDKDILQALIRAAGTYVHLKHGRLEGANKMAVRAVETLLQHKEMVPSIFNVEVLVAKLTALDPVPPKFGQGNHLSLKS
jgi:hypothetical protein